MDVRGPRLIGWAPWVFIGFGALVVLIGLMTVYSGPAGFAAIAFGAVFIGIGWLARRLLAVPPGMKAISVESTRVGISRTDGRTGVRWQASTVLAPEAADEDEVRAGWLRDRIADRPDWLARRIVPEGARGGRLLAWTAALWLAITAAAVVAGVVWAHAAAWAVAAGAGLTGLAPLVMIVRERLQRRKFGASVLAADSMPFRLGGTLSGTLETGIPPRRAHGVQFQLRLTCAHHWEETRGSGSDRRTVQRHDVLWTAIRETAARPGAEGRIVAPVRLEIPAGMPASTLGSRHGIRWELAVTANVPGLDYAAAFAIPVVAADAVSSPAPPAGPPPAARPPSRH